jgi:hypothetical protein
MSPYACRRRPLREPRQPLTRSDLDDVCKTFPSFDRPFFNRDQTQTTHAPHRALSRFSTDASARRDFIEREVTEAAAQVFVGDDPRDRHVADRKPPCQKSRQRPGPG